MSDSFEGKKQIETLAWVTDDEAEFWTSMAPWRRNDTSDHFSKSNGLSSDGLYFKSKNELNTEIEDHLALLNKQEIEKQAKEVENNIEKKPISEIFEFNKNIELNENIPGINMNFLDRLFHQLTRPFSLETDSLNDEDFTEIDESEITSVVNNNINIDKNKLKNDHSFMNIIRSFLVDLDEEKNVIFGTLDKETFLNRRSRQAKS